MIKTTKTNLKIIYLKFGELVLKGKNRTQFSHLLFTNLKNALYQYKTLKYFYKYDSISITNIPSLKFDQIFTLIKSIPGISLAIKAYVIEKKIDSLYSFLLKNLDKNKKISFKINTKRIDKQFEFNSLNFNQLIGDFVLKEFKNYYVDVHKPQLVINIEITKNNFIVYWDKQKAIGGLPLGINGKVLILISGGIDSPVAAHLLMKRGFHVDFLTFISPPHTSKKSLDKTIKLIKKLTLNGKIEQNPILYVCKFTNLQHEISHITNHSYQIIIMRRYFFKIAEFLAKKNNYLAIATGENLGQVASQTLESITTISQVLNHIVVLRPLLTYDKNEIIALAKKIETYDLSILPYADACSLFVPTNPITKPKVKIAIELEKELLMIEPIYQQTINKDIIKKDL